jgi:hypothetical protein
MLFGIWARAIAMKSTTTRLELFWLLVDLATFLLAKFKCKNLNFWSIQINFRWDTEKREEIVTMEVPNTTYFEWAPDGQHFLTATTSPRLRIDNNYRIWNYGGKDVYERQMVERVMTPNGEENKQIELAQVLFLFIL